ncbi:precorrin-6y C5,15-methyltransferase (decarboxylating) subunit CbiE [Scytonema sp. UIC 10036]|uniref:precorrin-6y C5,15-methyltransferase (decarboxylating) subunit CbiE n=1 Tax=Scytonema sp. UIC 10036 TaxID=2304196 RepID=UPI0012DA97B9|nr:precorrin-6y C5,15-methyltransferase (decarboxylating) subunit CbiE [Scytonema sp. UIC 10036]MUG94586.1 precorrin-6y C5,15-methyltransferase (decarboxylating) subunit CbiE [Scytonema sp. UIC 10036]
MTKVNVVGIGLDGIAGLSEKVREIIERATLLVGSDRHLSYFPNHHSQRLPLKNFTENISIIRDYINKGCDGVVIIVSGDPLFFGLGRLLLAELPKDVLTFHPHLSSVQLAFNRVKASWHDARVISAHGRSVEELIHALQQGVEKIAVLTDGTNTPNAIAKLIESLNLPSQYQLWVCENLGGDLERIESFSVETLCKDVASSTFAPLNVVVLLRQDREKPLELSALPYFGLPDECFLSFSDRPGLMTKREVRTLVLAELALRPGQIIWDIGAGTGSVSIEIARLFPTSKVYAIEKTAAGSALIAQNCRRFQVENVISIHGNAPDILQTLGETCNTPSGEPSPDRIFIGGSGGNLTEILNVCATKLTSDGIIVLSLATLEHLNTALSWFQSHSWHYQLLQVQLSRSVPIGHLTRFAPLNPVTIVTACH